MSANMEEILVSFLRDFFSTLKLTISVPKAEVVDIYENFLVSDQFKKIQDLKKSLGPDSEEVLMLIQQAKSQISSEICKEIANNLRNDKSTVDESIEYELSYDPISESFKVIYDHALDEDEAYIDAEGHLASDPQKQVSCRNLSSALDYILENFLEQRML